MPTEEQKRQYAANRSAKRAKDKYEALPQTRALRGEFNALKESIAGERAYMWNADYEAKLVERAEMWKSEYEKVMAERESAANLRESNMDFLFAAQAKMADAIQAAFEEGRAAGKKVMAESLLTIVRTWLTRGSQRNPLGTSINLSSGG